MKVLLFNGPPRCGKDTAALFVSEGSIRSDLSCNVTLDRFSTPLKMAFAATMDVPQESIDEYGNVYPYENTKDQLIPLLGVSYRQWQIDFAEKFMKKTYGETIFAKLFIERNRDWVNMDAVVVPDSGFECEVAPVVEAFGQENVILFRIHRSGYDFSNDSRSYLRDGLVPNTHDVRNDGTVEEFQEKIRRIAWDFLRDG